MNKHFLRPHVHYSDLFEPRLPTTTCPHHHLSCSQTKAACYGSPLGRDGGREWKRERQRRESESGRERDRGERVRLEERETEERVRDRETEERE